MKGCAIALALVAASASAATHVVVARGVAWDPKTLRVARGDTVVWRNTDIVPHNARQDARLFWSRDLAPGASFKWKAAKRGTWPYRCTLHPEMTGTIVVQ